MMDMREFQEKLEQLMELAAKQEQNLNNEQILEIFGLNQLSPQQLQSLYEYLRIQGIRIQGADLAPMDIGKALDPQEEQEEVFMALIDCQRRFRENNFRINVYLYGNLNGINVTFGVTVVPIQNF